MKNPSPNFYSNPHSVYKNKPCIKIVGNFKDIAPAQLDMLSVSLVIEIALKKHYFSIKDILAIYW